MTLTRQLAPVLLAIGLLFGVTGCAKKSVTFTALEGGDVDLGVDVKQVGVIDRSRGNKGFAAIESVFTMERIGEDPTGRRAAASYAAAMIGASPIFDRAFINMKTVPRPHRRGRAIDWDFAEAWCREYGCDVIVGMEKFDTNRGFFLSRIFQGIFRTGYVAKVRTEWTVYDVRNRTVLDEHEVVVSWYVIPNATYNTYDPFWQDRWIRGDLRSAVAYTGHISPMYQPIERRIYAVGDVAKRGVDRARDRDWEEAAARFAEAADGLSGKAKAKALVSQAAALEAQGKLTEARDIADKAFEAAPWGYARDYAVELEERRLSQERGLRQLEARGIESALRVEDVTLPEDFGE